MAAQYSILVDVEFQTKEIQKKLENATKNAKIKLDSSDLDTAIEQAEKFGLTFQEANLIMSKSLEIITAMVDEVYTLDSAMTEFKKVSSLDGSSLDAYEQKLASIGKTVARTGKPKCQARGDGMANQHRESP